jgi:dUTP pyrophosphatase
MHEAEQVLGVVLLSPNATTPARATSGSAGYDLYCSAECEISARGHALLPTDIAIAVPPGYYGRVGAAMVALRSNTCFYTI